MKIYVEPLIFDNFFLDLLLAYLTLYFCKGGWKGGSIISALLGTVCALFFPLIPQEFVWLYKFATLLLCIIPLKKPRGVKDFFKTTIVYLSITFALNGAISVLLNGSLSYTPYYEKGWLVGIISISALTTLFFARKIKKYFKLRNVNENITVKVKIGEEIKELKAFVDTGNKLLDEKQEPIAIFPQSEKGIVKNVIPSGLIKITTVNGVGYEEIYTIDELTLQCGKKTSKIENAGVVFSPKGKKEVILALGHTEGLQ